MELIGASDPAGFAAHSSHFLANRKTIVLQRFGADDGAARNAYRPQTAWRRQVGPFRARKSLSSDVKNADCTRFATKQMSQIGPKEKRRPLSLCPRDSRGSGRDVRFVARKRSGAARNRPPSDMGAAERRLRPTVGKPRQNPFI